MKKRRLGNSGLRVSEICLGTMTMGEDWGWGADKATSLEIYKTYVDAGGNFIDTANRYTEGSSERFLGEFIAPMRNEIVLATKYSLRTGMNGVNDGGNHRKNMVQSLEASLKRLNMDYIDVFYLHAWDFATPVDEVMRGLDDLVRAGKVLYIAISDTPAWVVSRANTMAELQGWSKFIGYQVEYSLLQRTPERDIIPMADEMGLAVLAWAPLAGGALTGKYLNATDANNLPGRLKIDSTRLNERAQNITKVVLEIAKEQGCNASHVAMNWVRQNKANVIPIVGARKVEQISDSIDCLKYSLSDEQMARLNEVSAIELGFPHDFLSAQYVKDLLFGGKPDEMDLRF